MAELKSDSPLYDFVNVRTEKDKENLVMKFDLKWKRFARLRIWLAGKCVVLAQRLLDCKINVDLNYEN